MYLDLINGEFLPYFLNPKIFIYSSPGCLLKYLPLAGESVMDRYSRRSLEDLVVPNYHETSDSYPSPDMWGTGWSMNSSEAVEKCFDYDVINNGFSGGLYSQMEMGTSEEAEEESKRLKASGCFDRSLHDFDGIQQMDDIFLYSSTHLLSQRILFI